MNQYPSYKADQEFQQFKVDKNSHTFIHFVKRLQGIKQRSLFLDFEKSCRPNHTQKDPNTFLINYELITKQKFILPEMATSSLQKYKKFDPNSKTRCSNVCFTESATRNKKQTNTRILCPYCDPFVPKVVGDEKRKGPLFYDTLGAYNNHHLKTSHGIIPNGFLVRRPTIGFTLFDSDDNKWHLSAVCPYTCKDGSACLVPSKFDPSSTKKSNPYLAYIGHCTNYHLNKHPRSIPEFNERKYKFVPLHKQLHASVLNFILKDCFKDPFEYADSKLINDIQNWVLSRKFITPNFLQEDYVLDERNKEILAGKTSEIEDSTPTLLKNQDFKDIIIEDHLNTNISPVNSLDSSLSSSSFYVTLDESNDYTTNNIVGFPSEENFHDQQEIWKYINNNIASGIAEPTANLHEHASSNPILLQDNKDLDEDISQFLKDFNPSSPDFKHNQMLGFIDLFQNNSSLYFQPNQIATIDDINRPYEPQYDVPFLNIPDTNLNKPNYGPLKIITNAENDLDDIDRWLDTNFLAQPII